MNRSWIVCWHDSHSNTDFWEVFDSRSEAHLCYNNIVEDCYVAAITSVIESTDYEPVLNVASNNT
jgi:hypothetical protein